MNDFIATVFLHSGPEEFCNQEGERHWSIIKFRAVDARRRKVNDEWEDAREPLWLDLIISDSNRLFAAARDELRPKMSVRIEGELCQKSYEKDSITKRNMVVYVRSYQLLPGTLTKFNGGPLPLATPQESFEAQLASYDEFNDNN